MFSPALVDDFVAGYKLHFGIGWGYHYNELDIITVSRNSIASR